MTDDFAIVSTELPALETGQVLVRNRFMSVDPYMRGRMRDSVSYAEPFETGAPLGGHSVGEVIASADPAYEEGDAVCGFGAWREHFVAAGMELAHVAPTRAPLPAYIGTLGMPGMTAYVGLLDIGRAEAGQTVFVSAAAGAVGSIVGQIAKIKGCRVVGSAGSEAKGAWLTSEAGFDAAFNYNTTDHLPDALVHHCPEGIDIYHDNVGGEHLEAAISRMNMHGRIALCGMISQYNSTEPAAGPRNMMFAVGKRLVLQGFIVSDHEERRADFYADVGAWIAAGKITWRETVVQGLENAPEAFIGLFRGNNFGKMVGEL